MPVYEPVIPLNEDEPSRLQRTVKTYLMHRSATCPWAGRVAGERWVSTGHTYGMRLPDSQVNGHNATLLAIGMNHHGRVVGVHAVQWVAIRIPMPLQARVSVLRGGGGKDPPGIRVTMAIC